MIEVGAGSSAEGGGVTRAGGGATAEGGVVTGTAGKTTVEGGGGVTCAGDGTAGEVEGTVTSDSTKSASGSSSG